MNKHVTNRQLFFIIFLLLASYSVIELPKVMAESAGTGAWLPLLLGALFFAAAAAIIAKVNSAFPEDTLFEYSKKLVGNFLSYVFATVYFLYFFVVFTLILRSTAEVIKADFLTRTPMWATMLMLLIVCGYAAAKGLTNVGRLAEYFGFFVLIASFIIHSLMFIQGDVLNIQPVFNASLTGEYFGALPLMILPFLGVEVITVIPFSKKNGTRAVRAASASVLFVGVFYIFVVLSSFAILGVEDAKSYNDAVIVAIRRIDMEFLQVLKRIDVLFIISWVWAIFCTFSILIFTVSAYANKIVPRVNNKWILIVLCALSFFAALLLANYAEVSKLFSGVALYFGFVPSLLIPLFLFIVMKVKRHE